jgi:hypothetical protein
MVLFRLIYWAFAWIEHFPMKAQKTDKQRIYALERLVRKQEKQIAVLNAVLERLQQDQQYLHGRLFYDDYF